MKMQENKHQGTQKRPQNFQNAIPLWAPKMPNPSPGAPRAALVYILRFIYNSRHMAVAGWVASSLGMGSRGSGYWALRGSGSVVQFAWALPGV